MNNMETITSYIRARTRLDYEIHGYVITVVDIDSDWEVASIRLEDMFVSWGNDNIDNASIWNERHAMVKYFKAKRKENQTIDKLTHEPLESVVDGLVELVDDLEKRMKQLETSNTVDSDEDEKYYVKKYIRNSLKYLYMNDETSIGWSESPLEYEQCGFSLEEIRFIDECFDSNLEQYAVNIKEVEVE
ncbi:hypothetical protein ACVQ8P_08040 [Dellaglioa sp. BT-FLS60]